MAKKKTTKKKTTKKSPAKSTKTKAAVIKSKKTPVKKTTKKKTAAVKKTAAKTTKTRKKTTVKKTAPKKPAAKKNAVKKTTKTAAKTTVKKTAAPKPAPKKIEKIKKPVKKVKEEIVPAVQKPVRTIKDIKGYKKEELEHFKKIILEKRDEIIEQLQNLKEQMLDPTTGEYINENSPYSLHMAEQGTDAMEREKTFLYAQRENKFLGYLEDALKRIEAGTYGICIECVEEPQYLCETCPLVPKARLEAVPHSQLCLPMKQRQEKR